MVDNRVLEMALEMLNGVTEYRHYDDTWTKAYSISQATNSGGTGMAASAATYMLIDRGRRNKSITDSTVDELYKLITVDLPRGTRSKPTVGVPNSKGILRSQLVDNGYTYVVFDKNDDVSPMDVRRVLKSKGYITSPSDASVMFKLIGPNKIIITSYSEMVTGRTKLRIEYDYRI